MIEISKVNLEFGEKVILKDISLSINKGEIAIILGPSGAGKSSILKIILGLWQPDSGKVYVDGTNITGMSEAEILPIRSKMGIVFQANALFDSLNVEDNVSYFLKEHSKLSPDKIKEKVAEILSFVNLKGTEKICIDQLSG
ncbi:MAG: ATP-binding cassette domain-containing protein, partial [Ignavibacteriaceae bacterium]